MSCPDATSRACDEPLHTWPATPGASWFVGRKREVDLTFIVYPDRLALHMWDGSLRNDAGLDVRLMDIEVDNFRSECMTTFWFVSRVVKR